MFSTTQFTTTAVPRHSARFTRAWRCLVVYRCIRGQTNVQKQLQKETKKEQSQALVCSSAALKGRKPLARISATSPKHKQRRPPPPDRPSTPSSLPALGNESGILPARRSQPACEVPISCCWSPGGERSSLRNSERFTNYYRTTTTTHSDVLLFVYFRIKARIK